MNAVEFADLLAHPNQLSTVAYEMLEQQLLAHPYCNGLRMLLLKKYKNDKHGAFERHLMLASMYATDRGRLYDYLHTSVVSNAQLSTAPIEETAAEAAADAPEEQAVVLVDPPNIYQHKVSENPPMLAFQPPLTAEELAEQKPLIKEERDDLSIMPIEEWLSQPSKPAEDQAVVPAKESPQRRSFKLSRIPTFKVNMNDFLEGKPVEETPIKEATPVEEKPNSNPSVSEEAQVSDEADVFDFFMQQTNSFLQSLHARKEGKSKPILDEELEDQSTNENDAIISETLAGLLAAQGQNAKAIKMYAALSLKFPEKSRFFADRIAALKV